MGTKEEFNESDLEAIRVACRVAHEGGKYRDILRAFCACGHPSSGDQRNAACKAYRRLVDAVTAPQ